MKYSDIITAREASEQAQNGIFPICKRAIRKPSLDHDHDTGHVRDVLCHICNWMEGKIKLAARKAAGKGNEAEFLIAVVEYWRNHQMMPSGIIHPRHKKKKGKSAKSKHIKYAIKNRLV